MRGSWRGCSRAQFPQKTNKKTKKEAYVADVATLRIYFLFFKCKQTKQGELEGVRQDAISTKEAFVALDSRLVEAVATQVCVCV